jgi:hypothetical protein
MDRVRALQSLVKSLDREVRSTTVRQSLGRWMDHSRALLFRLRESSDRNTLVVVLGGTGTGKSTVVNRLVGENLCTTSFRRTYTSGAVAIAGSADSIPTEWLGVPHKQLEEPELPARGEVGQLAIVSYPKTPFPRLVLVDTPDLDGDQIRHHHEADRAFRWADRVLFLVTPEKYQMKELWGYYHLADRYGIPAWFAMNKCEESEPPEDYARQLEDQGWEDPAVYSLPRDDASFRSETGLEKLSADLRHLPACPPPVPFSKLKNQTLDLLAKAQDQVVQPLLEERKKIAETVQALRRLESPAPDLEVDPLTDQLQRRMRERSVLYLLGPQRMMERAQKFFSVLRERKWNAWSDMASAKEREVPDFWQILVDQFMTAQSRMDDAVRSSSVGEEWIESDPAGYAEVKIDPGEAGRIAEKEIEDLKEWLQKHWDENPRDTKILEKLLKYLPGGSKLAHWTEAAPYLLILVCAVKGAFFGPLDFLVIGGFNLATWLGEKLSNEITARARQTNQRILSAYSELIASQIERFAGWLEERAPAESKLRYLEEAVVEFHGALEEGRITGPDREEAAR